VRREPVTGRVLASTDDAALASLKVAMASDAAAERDGFDAGYFGNPRQMVFATGSERIAYDRAFVMGIEQRAAADACGGSPPKKRR